MSMIQSDPIRNRSVSDIVTSFDLHEVQSRLPESVPCRERPVHVASEIPTSAEEPEAETVARIAMERVSSEGRCFRPIVLEECKARQFP